MPIKSKKQFNFMQMIAHGKNPSKTKGIGPSEEVAREFIKKTSPQDRKKFAKKKTG